MAFALGVSHALEPGHGKTALGARAIGGDYSGRMVLWTAVISAFTHLLLLSAVAFVFHLLVYQGSGSSHEVANECFVLLSAACLIGAGSLQFRKNDFQPGAEMEISCKCCNHSRGVNSSSLLIGLSIGLIPCPTMIAMFLASLSQTDLFSLSGWLVSFGLGMFVALSAIGLALIWLRGKISYKVTNPKWFSRARHASAMLIISLGVIQLSSLLF